MANTIPSPNMNMPVPVVGVDPGPDWANNVNASLAIVDAHNHIAGSGVPITPAAININTDLTMNNNNLTNAKSVRFYPQNANLGGAADLGCLYEVGVDLYYNDGNGNQIRFTQGGSIVGATGTITGLPSGTASASYAAGVFTFQSATNTPANIDGGSFVYRNNVANSKGLTLSPPNAMGADFSLVLPNIPATQSIMSLDTSGNIAANYTVDNATIVISSNIIQIPSDVDLPGTPRADGRNIVVMGTNTSQTLMIIRGIIDTAGSGTILGGEGFSIQKVSTGVLEIDFTNTFNSPPAVTGSVWSLLTAVDQVYVGFSNNTNALAVANLRAADGSTYVDSKFSFIAIGQRA